MADEKDIIVEFLKGKSASKSKFYFKDFTELFLSLIHISEPTRPY